MAKEYLLDTNAAIALLEEDTVLQQFLSRADEVLVPIISIGELFFGAEKSGRIEANRQRIEGFIAIYPILGCDIETTRYYGRIRQLLRAKGRPIPQNDTWIAALALQHGLTLLTRDLHFNEVESLQVEGW